MNPVTLILWVGTVAASIVIIAIAALIVWSVVQTMRGKTTKRVRP